MTRDLHCPTCADEQRFAQPGCGGEHLGDCPEWFCTACGTAIIVGVTGRSATVAA